MAIRNIVKEGDPVLEKKCRVVERIDQRVLTLLDDMADTMYEANGVGLAAPQVGVLKRVVVIDVGEGLIEMINPEIIAGEGSAVGTEGCLSVPGRWGEVERPERVTVRYLDRGGNECILEAEGLLAVASCHELDHLDGHLFVEKVIRFVEVEE